MGKASDGQKDETNRPWDGAIERPCHVGAVAPPGGGNWQRVSDVPINLHMQVEER